VKKGNCLINIQKSFSFLIRPDPRTQSTFLTRSGPLILSVTATWAPHAADPPSPSLLSCRACWSGWGKIPHRARRAPLLRPFGACMRVPTCCYVLPQRSLPPPQHRRHNTVMLGPSVSTRAAQHSPILHAPSRPTQLLLVTPRCPLASLPRCALCAHCCVS
jgi:hypothetical protein